MTEAELIEIENHAFRRVEEISAGLAKRFDPSDPVDAEAIDNLRRMLLRVLVDVRLLIEALRKSRSG